MGSRHGPSHNRESQTGCALAAMAVVLALCAIIPVLASVLGIRFIGNFYDRIDRDTAQGLPERYYAAVVARDWNEAATAVSTPSTATDTAPAAAAVQALWAQREATRGPLVGYTATALAFNQDPSGGTTATVTGTLQYTDGTTQVQTTQVRKWHHGSQPGWEITSGP